MKKTAVRLLLLSLIVLVAAMPAFAGKKKGAETEPGKYEEWQDEIDEIEIIQKFSISEYDKLVIVPFDTSDTELPEKDDNTYEPVKNVLKNLSEPLVEGVNEGLPKNVKLEAEAGDSTKAPRTLVLRGKVVTMNPGSRAARYWGGFGAGAAATAIEGEVVDAATGAVLLKFTQERRSGVGVAGGDYENLLNRNLEKIGEDVALILKSF